MKKIHGFTILESEEEVKKVVGCKHKFVEENESEAVFLNPNGEFVVGYGNAPFHASVIVRKYQKCVKCGYIPERMKR